MKLKKWCVGLTIALIGSTAAGVLLWENSEIAMAAEWTEIALQSEYLCGSTITIPERSVTANGSTQKAVSVLTYPSGKATLANENVLSEIGEYSVTYTATIGNDNHQKEERFVVYDTIAHIGESSSYSYEKFDSALDTHGLRVKLVEGERLEFVQPIDVKNITAASPLLEMFVIPQKKGTADFSKMVFSFADAENSDITMTVTATLSQDANDHTGTYCLAAGNNQPFTGYEAAWDRLHVEDGWGTWALHSFYGDYSWLDSIDEVKLGIAYDAQTQCVYTGSEMIIDLDSALFFNTLWHGFPSGKATLSVWAEGYNSLNADFMITSVHGIDLSQKKFSDNTAPQITINTDYEEAPVAKVGQFYSVPDATAVDFVDGVCSVTHDVYFNYHSENSVMVAVEGNGFVPNRSGYYAVVYRARDIAGNESEAIYWIEAKEEVPAVELNLGGEYAMNAMSGELVTLAQAAASGGSGNISVKTEVLYGNERIEISDDAFRPERSGEYTVRFTATDYIGQTCVKEYKVTVTRATKPIFVDDPLLPHYLFSGSEYEEIHVRAYLFADEGRTEKAVTLKVTDSAGERTVSGSFIPVVTHSGDPVTLTFVCENADPIVRTVPCIMPFVQDNERPRLKMEHYFVGNGVTAEAQSDSVKITAEQENGSFEFANKLLARGMSINLRGLESGGAFDGLSIVLRDSVNQNEKAELTLSAHGVFAVAKVGNQEAELKAGFGQDSASRTFEIVYRLGSIAVNGVMLETDAVFSSEYVYATVSFIGAKQNAAFEVTDVNGQPISDGANDRIRPKIAILGEYGDTAALGTEQIIPRALAGDVLDPNSSLSLTVFDPNGNAVISKDGVLLQNVVPDREFTIVAEKYGQYHVDYISADTFGKREFNLGYVITVEDREKPQIEFSCEFAKEIKLGEVIVVPNFTVRDNVTEAENIVTEIYVSLQNGQLIKLDEGSNAFRPIYAGEYKVLVIATDETGNMTMETAVVTVKE